MFRLFLFLCASCTLLTCAAQPSGKAASDEMPFTSKVHLTINGCPLDTFVVERFAQCYAPDSIHRSDKAIFEEFGAYDYELFYGSSRFDAGHGYLLSAIIDSKGPAIQSVQIGDSRSKLDQAFGIVSGKRSKVVILNHDDRLEFHLSPKGTIVRMCYYGPAL